MFFFGVELWIVFICLNDIGYSCDDMLYLRIFAIGINERLELVGPVIIWLSFEI